MTKLGVTIPKELGCGNRWLMSSLVPLEASRTWEKGETTKILVAELARATLFLVVRLLLSPEDSSFAFAGTTACVSGQKLMVPSWVDISVT